LINADNEKELPSTDLVVPRPRSVGWGSEALSVQSRSIVSSMKSVWSDSAGHVIINEGQAGKVVRETTPKMAASTSDPIQVSGNCLPSIGFRLICLACFCRADIH